MTNTRRQNERHSILVPVELEYASGKREARISDISAGGCYIDTIVSVTVGEEVRFELEDPNGGKLSFTGMVAYQMPGLGFGVAFVDLSDEQKLFLDRIL